MAGELTRHSIGLTDAHRELIKILAAKAVEDFLAESETIDEAVQVDEDQG